MRPPNRSNVPLQRLHSAPAWAVRRRPGNAFSIQRKAFCQRAEAFVLLAHLGRELGGFVHQRLGAQWRRHSRSPPAARPWRQTGRTRWCIHSVAGRSQRAQRFSKSQTSSNPIKRQNSLKSVMGMSGDRLVPDSLRWRSPFSIAAAATRLVMAGKMASE